MLRAATKLRSWLALALRVQYTAEKCQSPEHRPAAGSWVGCSCTVALSVPPFPLLNHWLDLLAWPQTCHIATGDAGWWLDSWLTQESWWWSRVFSDLLVWIGGTVPLSTRVLVPCALPRLSGPLPARSSLPCCSLTMGRKKPWFLEFWKWPRTGKFPKIFSAYPRLCHPPFHTDTHGDAHIVNTFWGSSTQ